MKRLLTTLVLVAAMAAIPPQAKTQGTKPDMIAVPAAVCGVLIITGVGIVVVVGVVKLCKNIASNQHWKETNIVGEMVLPEMPLESSGLSGPVTVQSSSDLGSVWVNEVQVQMTEFNTNWVRGVAYVNGLAVATNEGRLDCNGWATLDFSRLHLTGNNPTGRFFRLTQ